MTSDLSEIQALVKLFNPEKSNRDDESEEETNERQKVSNVTDNNSERQVNPYAKIQAAVTEDEKLTEEYGEDVETSHVCDWKKTPKWDISYRQKVTSEDVFLQMGGKTPSTSSCEDMIISIEMPGDHMQNMDIKVLEKTLEINSPNYFLHLPLPQPVHTKKGNAQWDKHTEKLTVTLRMDRELDCINF